MYSILIPVGTAEAGVSRAVETVESFPGQGELSVIVVHVSSDIDFVGSDGSYVSIDHEELTVPGAVEDTVSAFDDRGIPVELMVREGEPVDEILEIIDEEAIDHVIIPDKRRSPVGKVFFGGTTLSLIRDSVAPVTVVPAIETE